MKIFLKAARVNAELTQAQVAKSIGINVSTLIKWANRRTFPKSYRSKSLCLHVAHTCNLNCECCFASRVRYYGWRTLMCW